ncbi:MAG: universal stress protein [Alphaproteobacteria bacterium]|jgi:nucleotide-binding universal stress UspA family protein|nr:universal stress protein [Alphaproteobacteria bacterium]
MPYKDILVHVDGSKSCASRIELAASMARAQNAHLIGLFIASNPEVPEFVQAMMGQQVQDVQAKYLKEATAAAQTLFEGIAKSAGVAMEWRAVEGHPVEQLSLHGRYADLVVVGQRDTSSGAEAASIDIADELVFELGRPVMVVPYTGNFKKVGERIMVAWNASRESTRAVGDTVPVLRDAKQVIVLAINPKGGRNGHGAVPGADIAQHLARHGAKAEAQHVFAEDVDVGNMLLSRAADENVDLIVMGCYGRSRLREMVLGGATRHILKHMTVPVIMSH